MVTQRLYVTGMRCKGCEPLVERALAELEGVQSVKAYYPASFVDVAFDPDQIGLERIKSACAAAGYRLEQPGNRLLPAVALLATVLLLVLSRKYGGLLKIPEVSSGAGYSAIFAAGLLTGVHCVGMCGSFILGYCAADVRAGRSSAFSHLRYGAAKTVSYAVLGGIFGYLGSLFSITPLVSGVSLALAGTFLILYGMNTLRAFSFITRLLKRPSNTEEGSSVSVDRPGRGPLLTGLFSGLILGCGPLQAMYVLAAANGSALQGGLMLGLFGLGTLPALAAFGFAAHKLSGVMTQRFLRASGLILVALGVMMLNKGVLRAGAPPAQKVHSCCHAAQQQPEKSADNQAGD